MFVDVVAPSSQYIDLELGEVWTTDKATGGYNPDGESTYLPSSGDNYQAFTGRFGGTSAACPLVAGIAALILSVDSDLDAADVDFYICVTAEQVGGYSYTYSDGNKSQEMGHGRVNAYAAVYTVGGEKKRVIKNEADDNLSAIVSPNITITPNPANPATTISYSIAKSAHVTFAVYSVTGQKVATLVDRTMPAGRHSVVFDGSSYASGVYFYRLETQGFAKTGKMLLMK